MSYALIGEVPERRSSGPAERVRAGAMLVVFLLIGTAIGAVGIVASLGPSLGWYPATPRATWAPPPGVLTTVRAGLHLAMAVAEWLVWLRRRDPRARFALGAFVLQQVVTSVWPVLFWAGYGTIGLADLWISFGLLLVLDALVALTMLAFWQLSRVASAVMALHLVSCLLSTVLVLSSAGMHAVL